MSYGAAIGNIVEIDAGGGASFATDAVIGGAASGNVIDAGGGTGCGTGSGAGWGASVSGATLCELGARCGARCGAGCWAGSWRACFGSGRAAGAGASGFVNGVVAACSARCAVDPHVGAATGAFAGCEPHVGAVTTATPVGVARRERFAGAGAGAARCTGANVAGIAAIARGLANGIMLAPRVSGAAIGAGAAVGAGALDVLAWCEPTANCSAGPGLRSTTVLSARLSSPGMTRSCNDRALSTRGCDFEDGM